MQPPLDGLPESISIDVSEMASAAAAYSLLAGTRRATRVDLLLSTVLEILAAGSMSAEEILRAVSDAWPGAEVSSADIAEVLEVATRPASKLVVRGDSFEGIVWHLDDAGRGEIETTQQWLSGFRSRAVDALQERAATDFRECTRAEAGQWVERLIGALGVGIRSAEKSYIGELDLVSAIALRPLSIDDARMRALVEDGVSADVAEFLWASAIAALDPTDPFGTEIVTVISTSCVLHGHLARLEDAEVLTRLGPLSGQEAVIDTPLLLALASGEQVREPLQRMLTAAVSAGLSVIVLEHYIEELNDLVAGVGESGQPYELEPILGDPEKRVAYMALSERDDLLSVYVQLRHEGAVDSWVGFERHVHGLGARLETFGAVIRPHGNSDDVQIESAKDALLRTIAEMGGERRDAAVDRDALTMSMALRHRRHFRRDHPETEVAWPGLFVITRDRRLTPAFRQLDSVLGKIPLALTPAQFTLLLARVRPVPEVAALTTAASQLLSREVANRVALRFPPAIAADLARRLGGAGGATDVRVAQFPTVGSVLEGTTDSSDEVFAEVERRRILRARSATTYANSLHEGERQASIDRLSAANRTAVVAQAERDLVVEQTAEQQAEIEQLRAQIAARPTNADLLAMRWRSSSRAVTAVLFGIFGVWLGFNAPWYSWVAAFVGTGLLWLQLSKWVDDPTVRLRDSIVGIAADLVCLLVALVGALR